MWRGSSTSKNMSLDQRYHCCPELLRRWKAEVCTGTVSSVHKKGKMSSFWCKEPQGLLISLCFPRNLREWEQIGLYSHFISQFILLINILSFPEQLTFDLQNPAFSTQARSKVILFNETLGWLLFHQLSCSKMWCFIPLLISIFRGFLFKIKTLQIFTERQY